MKFIKKYSLVIIIALGFLLLCKSCQSCSRARQLEFEEIRYEQQVDSLKKIIHGDREMFVALKDSIRQYKIKLDATNEINQTIKDQNDRLIKSNDDLSKSNNNLTNTINNINNSK